jgi:hypothetical protein
MARSRDSLIARRRRRPSDRRQRCCKSGVSGNRTRTVSSTVPGCDRARDDTRCRRCLLRHRPTRCAPACRAGCPPRAAPPEHRHRRGDRAARRCRRPGRAPGGCAVPAAAPGPARSRGRLRAAVLIGAHAGPEGKAPWSTTPYWSLRSTSRMAADRAIFTTWVVLRRVWRKSPDLGLGRFADLDIPQFRAILTPCTACRGERLATQGGEPACTFRG